MKIRMRVIDFDVGKTEGASGQHNFPQRLLIMITPSFVYLFKKMLQQTLKTILSGLCGLIDTHIQTPPYEAIRHPLEQAVHHHIVEVKQQPMGYCTNIDNALCVIRLEIFSQEGSMFWTHSAATI